MYKLNDNNIFSNVYGIPKQQSKPCRPCRTVMLVGYAVIVGGDCIIGIVHTVFDLSNI